MTDNMKLTILHFTLARDSVFTSIGKYGQYKLTINTYGSNYITHKKYKKYKKEYRRYSLEYRENSAQNYSKLGEYKEFILAEKVAINYELRLIKKNMSLMPHVGQLQGGS